jgi:hypothetical protein
VSLGVAAWPTRASRIWSGRRRFRRRRHIANINNRAALVQGHDYFDLATSSEQSIGPDPMDAIAETSALHELTAL